MCRNIKTLHNFEPPATDDEIRASALQYVRKISGFAAPSRVNEAAFARAVERVAQASHDLLDSLVTKAPTRDREIERGQGGGQIQFAPVPDGSANLILASARLRSRPGRMAKKSPPEDYGKGDQTTVAAFLPWRGLLVPSP